MFSQDAMRCFDAVIGEVDGATLKKTPWMKQAWHRRLTWVRWLRDLRGYVENLHTGRLALEVALQKIGVEVDERGHYVNSALVAHCVQCPQCQAGWEAAALAHPVVSPRTET